MKSCIIFTAEAFHVTCSTWLIDLIIIFTFLQFLELNFENQCTCLQHYSYLSLQHFGRERKEKETKKPAGIIVSAGRMRLKLRQQLNHPHGRQKNGSQTKSRYHQNFYLAELAA